MIEFRSGDILQAEADALVNTVNCVGYMGRGIAAQFKKAFPENFREYEAACRRADVEPGRMFITESRRLSGPRYIINFPTKRHWRAKSRLSDIELGLDALVLEVARLGIGSIAIPPLGCGLGGLDWDDVRPRIESAVARLPGVEAFVYQPNGAPDPATMARSSSAPRMSPGRAALVGLMERYLAGLMQTSISLLEVHKLMYFLQESGENLRLKYVKAHYGPYAENLRQVLARVEGHLVSGYADGGDAPDKQLELVPGASAEALTYLVAHPKTEEHFQRVSELVEGFETSFGLELLATVHWLATHEAVMTSDEAVAATYAWNTRKRRFSPEQIRGAWSILRERGWLPGAPSL